MLTDITRPEMRQALSDILDTFTGADGGVSFVRLMSLCIDLDKQASEGNEAAKQVLDCIVRLHKLIIIANRR